MAKDKSGKYTVTFTEKANSSSWTGSGGSSIENVDCVVMCAPMKGSEAKIFDKSVQKSTIVPHKDLVGKQQTCVATLIKGRLSEDYLQKIDTTHSLNPLPPVQPSDLPLLELVTKKTSTLPFLSLCISLPVHLEKKDDAVRFVERAFKKVSVLKQDHGNKVGDVDDTDDAPIEQSLYYANEAPVWKIFSSKPMTKHELDEIFEQYDADSIVVDDYSTKSLYAL